jgi:hypothetical protein
MEGRLQRVEDVAIRQAFHGSQRVAIYLNGQGQARADRVVVEEYRAGAADAVLAPDVGPGQPEVVSEEVAEEQPRLDGPLVGGSVDGDGDRMKATQAA